MPNILFLSNRIPFPVKDGHSCRTYNIIKGLARKNSIYFLSLHEGQIEPTTIQHFESFCDHVELFASPPKTWSFSMALRLAVSLISTEPYTVWRHFSPVYLKRVRELARSRRFDLIHCDILPLAYTIRHIREIPCSLTDHDVSYVKALRMSRDTQNMFLKFFLRLEAKKLKQYESEIFRYADIGIAVSDVDKAGLQCLCSEGNFTVIENGVDTRRFRPSSRRPEPRALVWVGGFGYAPNRDAIHSFLEKIYPLIKKKVPDITLNLIGGNVTERIFECAASDPSIRTFGYVEDAVPHIQRAAVFIAPITSGSGTRLKILEAMAAGKAIVTTSVGCEGIEGVDTIHYLVADNPADFAEKTVSVLQNPGLQHQLGMNARKLAVQKYDWDIVIDKINAAYESLLKNCRYRRTSTAALSRIVA